MYPQIEFVIDMSYNIDMFLTRFLKSSVGKMFSETMWVGNLVGELSFFTKNRLEVKVKVTQKCRRHAMIPKCIQTPN